MRDNLYLLWDPVNKWNAYTESTCPDPGAFPSYMYQKYSVPEKQMFKILLKLMGIAKNLKEKEIFPSPENNKKIFPKLENLLH